VAISERWARVTLSDPRALTASVCAAVFAGAKNTAYIENMIVTYRHRPKRAAKRAQPATIKAPATVRARDKRRAPTELPADPEADARVAAFFARMIQPPK
jgi:hypothetical protein